MLVRIISGAVATVIAVVVLLLHDTFVYNVAIAAVCVGSVFELLRATKLLLHKRSSLICLIMAAGVPIIELGNASKYRYPFLLLCIFALFLTFLADHKKIQFDEMFTMIFAALVPTLALNSLVILKDSGVHGVFFVVLTLAGAWLADTGAYFVGTFFGKHKLCPNISPKKTIEGVVGGAVVDAILLVCITLVYDKLIFDGVFDPNYVAIAVIGALCSLIGLLGDLSASVVKRQCGIKDYGNIMPGHGGFLDRFDSVLFVAPFMVYALPMFFY